ncbi:MAG: hypothetical protein QOC71_655 [Thermoplasmata archaeon]|jgi:hypothetical protein|nr:hypothetical protein [Thermoplasmata archaeon]
MAKPAILCLLATLSLFSGCLSASPADPPADVGPAAETGTVPQDRLSTAAEPIPTKTDIPFTLLIGVGTPVSGTNAPNPVGPLRGGPFDVPEGTALLAIDADWTCASDPVCTLDLVLYDEDGKVAQVVTATDDLHVEVAGPGAGEWGAAMFASMDGSVVLQAEGTIHVTVTPSPPECPGPEDCVDGSAPSANA